MSTRQLLSFFALTTAISLTANPAAGQQPVWTRPTAIPATSPAAVSEPASAATSAALPAADPVKGPASAATSAALPACVSEKTTSAAVTQPVPDESARNKFYKPIAGKKNKLEYIGPKDVVELAPTPMLDQEGRQRLDPEGKPMFNPPIRQQRDKHGNPLFDETNKPVMQTASDLGYDDKGKKIHAKKEKAPRAVSVNIQRGTLTVDGMTGKAGLNYDIKDLRYLYIYAPWIGTTIISPTAFPGAIEQKNAFRDNTVTVTVEDHTLQIYSDTRLLGKKPESAFVAVDRSFKVPSTFPVVGYGETLKPPYAWPGSRENVALKGPVPPPPLPASVRPVTLLEPCPPGQMRLAGGPAVPGGNQPPQPCVSIAKAIPATAAAPRPTQPASTNASPQ